MKLQRDRMRLYAVTDKSWLKPGERLAEPVEELLKDRMSLCAAIKL